MSSQTRFEIRAAVRGIKEIDQLKRSIKQLKTNTKPAALVIAQLQTEARKLGSQSDVTENELRTSINVFKELRANVALTGTQYKDLTADIQKAEAALTKAAITSKKSNFSFRNAAKGLGAVAGAGVFGGPEGAIGATIGLFAGPQAALVGGAIGAQVGMMRKSIGETASYSAALGRQRKALKLVINDTKTYAAAQVFLAQRSKSLAIPQDVIVRQFTALTASVKGAGHSVEDAEKVFESIASGIRGTGGSLEDMKAAMTATAQVFSKGKVSAEELRQQLGERLPGAFTIFAESMDKTPAELDKALEGGKVTLDDFMKFSEVLFSKYGKNAEILAAGPEAAGDRLQTAMAKLKDNVGALLRPVGAAFQDEFTGIVESIDGAAKALKDFLKIGDKFIQEQIDAEQKLLTGMQKQRDLIPSQYPGLQERHPERYAGIVGDMDLKIAEQINKINQLRIKQAELNDEISNTIGKTDEMGKTGNFVWDNMKSGAEAYKESIKDINKQIQDATKAAFTKMEDALVDFVMTGKASFKEFARSVIADITRIFIRSQILGMFDFMGGLGKTKSKTIEGSVTTPNWGGGRHRITNALGNVYGKNGIVPFSKGGVVHSPHIFPFKDGIGLLGEAGSESIMPLKRGRDGKLGVIAHGGGTSVVVNVDASGSDVQGDEGNAAALGRAISSAVTEEIAKQKRPGGLLSAA